MKKPLSRFLVVLFATLLLAFGLLPVLPPPADLAIDAEKDLSLYSKPFPGDHSAFFPGEISTPDNKLVNWRAVPGALNCGECHLKETLEWGASMHAISDSDLLYDASVLENTLASKAGKAHGIEKGRWCESCHNPLGVVSGAVTPANSVQNLSAMEEGTACIVCHAVNKADPEAGNGAMEVDINGIFRYGHPALISAAPSRHAKDMRAKREQPLMGSSDLCGACHTETRPVSVNAANSTPKPPYLQNTYNEWKESSWAKAGIQCQDCHMAIDPGSFVAALKQGERPKKTVSHRIAGNNYLLSETGLPHGLLFALRGGSPPGMNRLFDRAAFIKELGRTNKEVVGLMREAAEIQVMPTPGAPADGALHFDVVVSNVGAGHAFPTGPLDQRYVWIEVQVKDSANETLVHQGAFDNVKGLEAPGAVRWMKETFDAEGKRDRHHMLFDTASVRYTRTPIAPGGTDTINYRFPLPEGAKGPLTVEVRLWYRLGLQEMLENIEKQNLGKIEAIIPPLLLEEASLQTSLPAITAMQETKQ